MLYLAKECSLKHQVMSPSVVVNLRYEYTDFSLCEISIKMEHSSLLKFKCNLEYVNGCAPSCVRHAVSKLVTDQVQSSNWNWKKGLFTYRFRIKIKKIYCVSIIICISFIAFFVFEIFKRENLGQLRDN